MADTGNGKVIVAPAARDSVAEVPDLIAIQVESYERFLNEGLKELFETFSPIEDFTGTLSLEFLDYQLGDAKYSVEECRERDITYELPLKAKVRLVTKETGDVLESEVYMGEIPFMTEKGTFLINGAERVVVSQLARSPGVYFKESIDFSGRQLFSAQLIPTEGVWIEFETDANDVIWVKIGQARKFPATTFLRAVNVFDDPDPAHAVECGRDPDLLELFGERVTLNHPSPEELIGKIAVDEMRDGDRLIVGPYSRIDEAAAEEIAALRRGKFEVLDVNRYIPSTMAQDPTHSDEEAILDIYRKIRPGDPPTKEGAATLCYSMFFDVKRYDLNKVGRHKLNQKLGLNLPLNIRWVTKHDIIAIIKYLLRLSEGAEGYGVDDIDHLENKRIRGVGELLLNQFRVGFLRMERVARERMTSLDPEKLTAQAIISIKPITAAVRSFFGSGQLSQFMDEVNPLSELTHKRRVSALGPDGLSRQSAKLEVRDVHHSHYGRICPIETPEGPNIGLIGSVAVHARLDEFGFIQTPYRVVRKGKITDQVDYLTADQERELSIAPADTPTEGDRFVADALTVRRGEGFPRVPVSEIDYIDVSPAQIFSVATSLIPFLENDDPIRGLMGSNMQRQAVPLLAAKAPTVHTGMEARAARDSGTVVLARAAGRVEEVDGAHVVVRRRDGQIDRYRLDKFVRTNQATCINMHRRVQLGQRVKEGDLLADGSCTDNGELALGRDVLVAYMPWRGYNYEDAIVLSERLAKDDVLTSIHIEKYEVEARDTKLGPEEITRDIPNVGDEALKHLDENGIVTPGSEVRAEDILVGKVAPKGQAELTAEEKLVIAIFGKKAEEMRDVSLRMPHGEKGKVVGIRVFSRFKYACDSCGAVYHYGRPTELTTCPTCDGRLVRDMGDELPPGVNQLVRVYVAQRRKIMVGDKLAGRHGNKGVISAILPEEDMPFTSDGRPVDVILNPLGVPSRLNVGQILECHLGLVSEELGVRFRSPIFEGFTDKEVYGYLEQVTDRFRARALKSLIEDELKASFAMPDTLDPQEVLEAFRAAARERTPEELLAIADIVAADRIESGKNVVERQVDAIIDKVRELGERRAGLLGRTGRMWLRDGMTGELFHQPVTVGLAYILKLIHLVEDKIHARSTGPYSLVTQQPLGGKAQFGGQRFGEMEVWALEAYGAAHALQEVLTIKSDDVVGRVKTYESIVKGENILEPGVPESFYILIKELESLALRVTILREDGEEVELDDTEEEIVAHH